MRSAGMVTPTPKAIDSPAEPVVCTMLFSRMVARRKPNDLEKARNRVMDSTAMGTDADTVMPTLSSRYSDDAPKRMPRKAPSSTDGQVNSGMFTVSGTYGSCFGVSGVGVTGGAGGWLVMLFGSAIASAPLEFGIGKVIQGRLAGWTWDFKPSRAISRRSWR